MTWSVEAKHSFMTLDSAVLSGLLCVGKPATQLDMLCTSLMISH